jgi:hypothetical protein
MSSAGQDDDHGIAHGEPSSDPNQEYFSDGLSEERSTGSDRSRTARHGRMSSFKDKEDDSRAVGQALGVANLLENASGRRRPWPNQRVAGEPLDGSQRWSAGYEGTSSRFKPRSRNPSPTSYG